MIEGSHDVNLRTLRRATPAAAVLSLALALSACGGGSTDTGASASPSASGAPTTGGGLSGQISGAGSSAQQAAMQAWVAGFTGKNPDVTVNYDPIGSGGGRKQFTAGAVNFAGSDAYLDPTELVAAQKVC